MSDAPTTQGSPFFQIGSELIRTGAELTSLGEKIIAASPFYEPGVGVEKTISICGVAYPVTVTVQKSVGGAD